MEDRQKVKRKKTGWFKRGCAERHMGAECPGDQSWEWMKKGIQRLTGYRGLTGNKNGSCEPA